MANASWLVWAIVLSGIAALATLITGVLFFIRGGVFGPINDAASVVQMLLMAITAIQTYGLGRAQRPTLALVALVVGEIALLTVAVLQALLVARVVTFEQTFPAVLTCGVGIGVWLILATSALSAAGVAPDALLLIGSVSGIAHTLPIATYRVGGEMHPLFYAGSLLGVLGYTVWAIWLSGLLIAAA